MNLGNRLQTGDEDRRRAGRAFLDVAQHGRQCTSYRTPCWHLSNEITSNLVSLSVASVLGQCRDPKRLPITNVVIYPLIRSRTLVQQPCCWLLSIPHRTSCRKC